MRTTVRLEDRLLKKAKRLAARTGRTLTAVIEDALREALAASQRRPRRQRITLLTFRGKGLHPGVNLDQSASLRETMEAPYPVPPPHRQA